MFQCRLQEEMRFQMQGRFIRRAVGALCARLPDVALHRVPDLRRGRTRWSLRTGLNTSVTALLCGCKSLAETEALTAEMAPAARAKLGLRTRLPDTTLRDLLVKIPPDPLRQAIYRQIKAAHRRKTLTPVGLPFGVVTMDGKVTAVRATRGPFVQPRFDAEKPYGLVRTVTATLSSSAAKVCLDASPIPPSDNEQTHYTVALESLISAYGRLKLFRLVDYDAGGCSRANASYTRECGLDYLMRVQVKSQAKLAAHMKRLLDPREVADADAVVCEHVSGAQIRRSIYLSEQVAVWPRRTELRTLVRLLWEKLDKDGHVVESENRYYVSSLAKEELSGYQWLSVIRGHWSVENNCHQTWDAVLCEDERPWITATPQGTLAVMLLRRIAYNILTLYRAVTLRGSGSRLTPWRDLCRQLYNALIAATAEQLASLRPRKPVGELFA
jgi:hypothetical protein